MKELALLIAILAYEINAKLMSLFVHNLCLESNPEVRQYWYLLSWDDWGQILEQYK